MFIGDKLEKAILKVLVEEGHYAESGWYGLGDWSIAELSESESKKEEVIKEKLLPLACKIAKILKQ